MENHDLDYVSGYELFTWSVRYIYNFKIKDKYEQSKQLFWINKKYPDNNRVKTCVKLKFFRLVFFIPIFEAS